jgi:hypothetical protein
VYHPDQLHANKISIGIKPEKTAIQEKKETDQIGVVVEKVRTRIMARSGIPAASGHPASFFPRPMTMSFFPPPVNKRQGGREGEGNRRPLPPRFRSGARWRLAVAREDNGEKVGWFQG